MAENMSVAAVVAVFVSLLLEWFPGLKGWWEKFTGGQKQGIMALLVAVVSVGVVLGNCYWWGEVCPANWVVFLRDTFLTFLAAATVNQGIHQLSKR